MLRRGFIQFQTFDLSETGIERTLALLQQIDHSQAGRAIRNYFFLTEDTTPQMLRHRRQGLAARKPRRIDVANSVARDEDLTFLLGVKFDAAVVDLQFLVRIEIVPDRHLPGAADRNAPGFDWRHPA